MKNDINLIVRDTQKLDTRLARYSLMLIYRCAATEGTITPSTRIGIDQDYSLESNTGKSSLPLLKARGVPRMA